MKFLFFTASKLQDTKQSNLQKKDLKNESNILEYFGFVFVCFIFRSEKAI